MSPAPQTQRFSDEWMEVLVSRVLRGGVLLAALTMLAGGVVYLAQNRRAAPDNSTFHSEPAELRSLIGVVHRAFQGDGRGIIELGILLLIATPIARVALSVIAFALRREPFYVIVTLIVLTVLLYGLVGPSS
jgi:uncharacterized membrane protein